MKTQVSTEYARFIHIIARTSCRWVGEPHGKPAHNHCHILLQSVHVGHVVSHLSRDLVEGVARVDPRTCKHHNDDGLRWCVVVQHYRGETNLPRCVPQRPCYSYLPQLFI